MVGDQSRVDQFPMVLTRHVPVAGSQSGLDVQVVRPADGLIHRIDLAGGYGREHVALGVDHLAGHRHLPVIRPRACLDDVGQGIVGKHLARVFQGDRAVRRRIVDLGRRGVFLVELAGGGKDGIGAGQDQDEAVRQHGSGRIPPLILHVGRKRRIPGVLVLRIREVLWDLGEGEALQILFLERGHGSIDPGLGFGIKDIDLSDPVVAVDVVPAKESDPAIGELNVTGAEDVVVQSGGIAGGGEGGAVQIEIFLAQYRHPDLPHFVEGCDFVLAVVLEGIGMGEIETEAVVQRDIVQDARLDAPVQPVTEFRPAADKGLVCRDEASRFAQVGTQAERIDQIGPPVFSGSHPETYLGRIPVDPSPDQDRMNRVLMERDQGPDLANCRGIAWDGMEGLGSAAAQVQEAGDRDAQYPASRYPSGALDVAGRSTRAVRGDVQGGRKLLRQTQLSCSDHGAQLLG